jgi:prolyl oligopeptidase
MRTTRFDAAACAILLAFGAHAIAADPLAPIGIAAKQPVAIVEAVTETLYGTSVVDPYRYFEKMTPRTTAWIEGQGAYTRAVLDAIAPRAALLERIAGFAGSFGVVTGYVAYGGREFFEERLPGADQYDLKVRDTAGTRMLVDIGALRARHGNAPYAIDFFLASPDGSKVAAGISEGGSEASSLFVYDAASGAQIAGPIDRADYGATAWSGDSRTLYFVRLKALAPDAPSTDKYLDATIDAWSLDSPPAPILGRTVGHGPPFEPAESPWLHITPGAPVAIALAVNGTQNEFAAWRAPVARVADPGAAWQPFFTRDAGITSVAMRGDEIFLLSHADAPMFKVLVVRTDAPLSSATTLVATRPDRLIESIHAASDALYVLTLERGYSRLLRIPNGSTEATEIPLPIEGYVSEAFTDPLRPGVVLTLESWTAAPVTYAYDATAGTFADLHLGTVPPYDATAFVVSDLEAVAADGTKVPLTLLRSKTPTKATQGITVIEAYGSYGLMDLPEFSPRVISFLREGGSHASCHVRGGGELGEAWRLGGKDANKPNTWRDLIACAQDLIARGVTTKEKLFISGGSAGGITVGMALTERPDLFAGVIDSVPAANTVRDEFSANGPPNIPEFGSIGTQTGFRNLLAMDSYQHVKDGVAYPAVLIMTGLNDPRVEPWEPAKFAARLQASGTPNPVLLRVEADGGHGVGSTRTQADSRYADILSFVFWRAGVPGWRPDARR